MTTKLLLAAGALFASVPTWGQPTPAAEPSAEDLVCQLSGDCSGMDQLEATQDKPESRGFKIARKVAANDLSPAVVRSSVRTAKVNAEAVRPSSTAGAPGRSRTIAATGPRAAIGRADLRVTFVIGSAVLTEAGRRAAEKFMTALTAPSLAGKKFRIEGHTDSVGSSASNVDLSKRRAQAVVEYLTAKGADAARFDVVGYGFDKPLSGLDASAAANRRVEIVLVQ